MTPESVNTNLSFMVQFRSQEYIPPTRISHDLNELQRWILACLQSLGPSNSSAVVEALSEKVDARVVLRNLQALRDYGLVVMTGKKRGAKWHLLHKPASGF